MEHSQKPVILVVDDEKAILKLVHTLLCCKGCHVQTASSAQEALNIMAEEPFDILITDHLMPGLTGLELILEVNRKYPDTIKILLTGVGDRDLYREAVNRGAVFSLIEKPFHAQRLLDTIDKAMDFRRSRMRDRQEILRLQEQYHAIFHNTADLIQCTDTRGNFIYVNPAWHHVMGYDEEILPVISLFDLAHSDCVNHLRSIIAQAGAGERVKTFETVLEAKNGAPVYLEGNATAQAQKSGVVSVICIFRDVTERKKAAAEIQARLRQETMIARIADLLARSDEPASAYKSILEIVGKCSGVDTVFIYSLNEVDQVFSMVEFWSASDGSERRERFRTIPYHELPWCHEKIAGGEMIQFDSADETPEPDRRFLECDMVGSILAFPIHIGSCVVGALVFEAKRGKRTREDHEIRMFKAAGDIVANAWTRQMEINVRRQKEIEAEQSRLLVIRADRLAALGTMAAGIIHEITQPLNAINVSTQTILYGLARGWNINEEKATRSLNLVVDQVKRMTDIIANIRAFTRDSLPAARENESLNIQVKRVFTMLGEQIRAHNIDVSFRLGDIPDIRMNTQQILQVIVNLVTNARQALDEVEKPGKGIVVSTFVEDQCAILEVTDNGPGISEHMKEKIFDPFFTTKEVGRGTGLGLSISAGIVHDHNGELDVRNNENGGATFVVRLPITS